MVTRSSLRWVDGRGGMPTEPSKKLAILSAAYGMENGPSSMKTSRKWSTEHTVTTNLTAHGLAGSRTVKNVSMEHTLRVEKMGPGLPTTRTVSARHRERTILAREMVHGFGGTARVKSKRRVTTMGEHGRAYGPNSIPLGKSVVKAPM